MYHIRQYPIKEDWIILYILAGIAVTYKAIKKIRPCQRSNLSKA